MVKKMIKEVFNTGKFDAYTTTNPDPFYPIYLKTYGREQISVQQAKELANWLLDRVCEIEGDA